MYVDVILLRTAEEGKVRLPRRYPLWWSLGRIVGKSDKWPIDFGSAATGFGFSNRTSREESGKWDMPEAILNPAA
jgi:hypothetical protein